MFVFKIKELRLKRNITIYRLSKITKLSHSYLSELENNKVFNPSLATMYKIAKCLNVSIEDLFYTIADIEELKQEMYKRIDKHGINSKEALEVSQLIDLLINIKMKGLDK